MEETRKKEKIKACIAICIIVLAILTTGIIILKYQIEGETNMPFKLSKITIVSTAEGVQKENAEEKWNFTVFQNNDIYFSIEKNENAKEENKIESIEIKNIQVTKAPKVGKINTYMPNSSEGRLFVCSKDTLVEDNKLTYKGATKSNSKTLEIGNQGGTAVIRISNTQIGDYVSNEEQEIKHDATLLKKLQLEQEQIEFNVTFDFIINLRNKSYIDTITLEMPCSKNLIEEGTSSKEITDSFVFKRVQN